MSRFHHQQRHPGSVLNTATFSNTKSSQDSAQDQNEFYVRPNTDDKKKGKFCTNGQICAITICVLVIIVLVGIGAGLLVYFLDFSRTDSTGSDNGKRRNILCFSKLKVSDHSTAGKHHLSILLSYLLIDITGIG